MMSCYHRDFGGDEALRRLRAPGELAMCSALRGANTKQTSGARVGDNAQVVT